MSSAASVQSVGPRGDRAARMAEESLYVLAGAGITFLLFAAMAHFEGDSGAAPVSSIEDMRSVSALYEPPPPKVEERPEHVDEILPLTGIDIGASESPVRITVVPPDLSRIIPTTEIPPKANIQISQLYTDLRPRSGVSGDADRIFRPSEVDRAPAAVIKTIAHVSHRAREDADELRATLELVVDAKGAVVSIRVLRSSGNPEFDAIVSKCVRQEWVFSPAMKNGKSVKCLVDQLVWYKWSTGSPFKI
jgi:TonB family protein